MNAITDRLPWAETIHHLAERWKDAGILLPAFPLLARGQPLTVDEIARASGASVSATDRALAAGRCERDADGRLIDLFGLTLTPTVHRLEIDRKILFSCCALWAHVIPNLVDQDLRVESVDPHTRELVRLHVGAEGVISIEPEGAMATLAVSSSEAVRSDVGEAFCCQVRHFVSAASAREFAAQNPRRLVVSIDELQNSAEQLFRQIWRATGAK